MKTQIIICCFFIFLISCAKEDSKKTTTSPTATSSQEITVKERTVNFAATDGVILFGDFYEIEKSAPIILLFHQARGSARGEYETIIPRLTANGYNVFAVDQRSGGNQFGSPNRTVEKIKGKEHGYCDAYQDLEAALNVVIRSGFTGSKFLWGSSYSAGLVIQLGDRRASDIDGVLAFSPASGGPMQDCNPNPFIASTKTPLIVLRPEKEMEVESVKSQFQLAQQKGHKTYIAKNGVHGSSMLVEARTGAEVESTWNVVFDFIDDIARK